MVRKSLVIEAFQMYEYELCLHYIKMLVEIFVHISNPPYLSSTVLSCKFNCQNPS